MDLGPPELILVLVVILVLFGGAQLPKLARNLGKAQTEFKQAMSGKDEPTKAKVADAADATQPADEIPAATPADFTETTAAETAPSNADA